MLSIRHEGTALRNSIGYIDFEPLFDHIHVLNKICLLEASYRLTQHQGLNLDRASAKK